MSPFDCEATSSPNFTDNPRSSHRLLLGAFHQGRWKPFQEGVLVPLIQVFLKCLPGHQALITTMCYVKCCGDQSTDEFPVSKKLGGEERRNASLGGIEAGTLDTHLKVKARNGKDASAAKGQDFLA